MVQLAVWRHKEPRKLALRDAIRFELETQQSTLAHKRLRIDIDLDPEIAMTPCSAAVCAAIETVLGVAIDRSPRGGELSIIGCCTSQGIELEVADDGDETYFPRFRAFQNEDCGQLISASSSRSQVSFVGALCPQGGMAWTILLNRTQAIAKAA